MLKECTLIEPLMVKETENVVVVAQKLREHLIRHIYVVNDNGHPVGVISTTDINNRVVAEGKNPTTLKAKDIMTKPIASFDETTEERSVYKECIKSKIATCPVTRNGKLFAMVTIEELLRKITQVEN